MKPKNRTSRKRNNAWSRLTASVLLVSIMLTLWSVPARAFDFGFIEDIFDEVEEKFESLVDLVEEKIKNLTQETVGPFIKEGLSVMGLDTVYNKAKQAVDFAVSAAEGKLPVVESMMEGVTGNVKAVAESAVSELSNVTEVLKALQDVGGELYYLLSSIPIEFDTDFSISLYKDVTITVRARHKDDAIDITFCLQGPKESGIQALFGLSNASPLGDGNAEHFANEGRRPTLFMDLTRNGRSYVHGRLPLFPGAFPYVIAKDYITLPNGKIIEVNLGALDETTISAEFKVSVEATCDYVASLSGGLGVSVEFEVNPNHANEVVSLGMSILMDETRELVTGGSALTLENAAEALKRVLDEMDQYGQEHEGSIGEATVGISLEGGIGAGVWDCTWNALTAETGLELVIPGEKLGSVAGDLVKALLESGKTLAEVTNTLTGWFLNYHNTQYLPTATQNSLLTSMNNGIQNIGDHLKDTAESLLEMGIDTEMKLFLTVDALQQT